jgi:tetratricopeptide (TPR) repeat protein
VLAGCRNNLSNVLIDLGKLEDAEIELRMALDLFAELAAEFPHRTEYHDSLAGSRMSLGALLIDLGKLGQGADELSVAINLYEKLATEFPTVAAHRSGLAASHYNLGIALRGLGKLAQAQREYRTALAIETKLVAEFPAAPKYRQSLAKTHSELALLFADMLGKRQEAEAECRAAHTIYQNLAIEFPGVPQYRLNLAGTHHSLGKVLFLLGKPEQAEAEYRTAFDIQAKLTKDYPAVTDHALGLAILIQDHGEQLVHHGRIAEGLPKLRQAASIWKGLAERSKEHPGYREMWAGALAYIAVCEAHSRNPQAEKTFQEAIELLKPLVADSPPTRPGHPSISALKAKAQSLGLVTGGVQPNPRNRLVSLYSNYANFLGEKMRFGEAVTAYVHALKLMPEHFAPLNGLAWLRAACPDAKYRNPGEAVELASKAVKAAPQVGGCWNTLGVAHYRQGDWKAAIEALNTSMELHPTKGDANDWFFLAMAHWQLGEKTKARSFHDRAVQWMVKHAPKDEELRRFRAEAEEVLGIKKDRP